MKAFSRCLCFSCVVLPLCVVPAVLAVTGAEGDERSITIAVASNFTDAMNDVAERFERKSGHEVLLSFGSTGKLYAQIRNGAPFEAFFAADVKRPELLDEEAVALPGSRFTYAIGRVALWSSQPGFVDDNGEVLASGRFRHLAIANPDLAPYGEAARAVLQARGVYESVQPKLVMGQNIGQTYQFIDSGNAELGFVAYSQLLRGDGPPPGSYWLPAQSLYAPIRQQAVVLKDGAAVRAFMEFLRDDEAIEVIRGYGYEVPNAD